MPSDPIPEPWESFLSALDAALPERVDLECLGAFVLAALHGLPRPTADVDVLSITPREQREFLLGRAGQGSPFHRRYRVYLAVLQHRYEQELRPNLGNPEREDLTLKLWIEAIQEERGQAR